MTGQTIPQRRTFSLNQALHNMVEDFLRSNKWLGSISIFKAYSFIYNCDFCFPFINVLFPPSFPLCDHTKITGKRIMTLMESYICGEVRVYLESISQSEPPLSSEDLSTQFVPPRTGGKTGVEGM